MKPDNFQTYVQNNLIHTARKEECFQVEYICSKEDVHGHGSQTYRKPCFRIGMVNVVRVLELPLSQASSIA